jgi:hypothetical protein
VPRSIEKHFPVRCLVPKQGSYALPLLIGNSDDLVSPQEVQNVVASVLACIDGLFHGDESPFHALRNPRYRIRVLDAFRTMLPKAGSPWKLGLKGSTQTEILLSGEDARKVSVLKERLRRQEVVAQTITGYLQAMEFENHRVTILYPENNRELECFYDTEWEPELIEARRGLVQVTGTVVVDADDLPLRISAVENIEPLEMSDFEVREVPWHGKRLIFNEPLLLALELTDSKQHLILKDDVFHIHVIAPTREDLLAELHEQIGVLWSEYALEDDGALSDAARALKLRLLSAIREE